MKKVFGRRPSASMVVALTALVVAMSGTAVAAGSLVTGNKLIKKHSLSGNRLIYKSVTGYAIKLSKLGTVPTAKYANAANDANFASNAGNADKAGSATNATNAANVAGITRFRTTIASAGTSPSTANTVTLGTSGPLTVYGVCYVSGGDTTAAIYMSTSALAHYQAYGETNDGTANPLTPGTPEEVSEDTASAPPGTIDQEDPYDGTFSAFTDDAGADILGLVTIAVNLDGGTGCSFGGFTESN